MLLAQEQVPADCRRVRSDPEFQACEVERKPHDVLNSARRPPAGKLGSDAIRFSMQPSLGGQAFIVEVVENRSGARVTIFRLSGHPYAGWEEEGEATSNLSPSGYRRLAAVVDHWLAVAASPPQAKEGEVYVCMDGPENLTERVRNGRVVTLSGFCPPNDHELHPNEHIAAALLSLACPSALGGEDAEARLKRNCIRWRKIAARDEKLVTR